VGVDALGNPVRFILTAGNVNDIVQAEDLIGGLSFDKLLADKGYDSDRFRASIARQGAEAVIPSTRSRSQAIPYDKCIYRERNLVERFFNRLKHYGTSGTCLRRGRPRLAIGQIIRTSAGYTLRCRGIPTAQASLRAVRPWRNGALIP
jgi:transposase